LMAGTGELADRIILALAGTRHRRVFSHLNLPRSASTPDSRNVLSASIYAGCRFYAYSREFGPISNLTLRGTTAQGRRSDSRRIGGNAPLRS